MKIKTIGTRIQLEVQESTVGALTIESLPTAIEVGKVIGVGEDVTLPVKKGDKIMYKSWAVDICTHEGKRFFFIDESTKGICGIIEK